MQLPRKIPKEPKRASRWRSQAHAKHVRSHSCANCGATSAIEFAHVRLGSGAGMGQRPDDWNAVGLCKPCHQQQHSVGERTFWKDRDVETLIDFYIRTSPRRREIEQVRRERNA